MRFLGIGDWNDLGPIYLQLQTAGHAVRVYIAKSQGHDILGGMVERVDDWRSSLDWIRAAGREGIILFETATMGALQDELRREGFNVVGGSAIGDRLEQDRSFGQEILDRCGMRTIPAWCFPDSESAADFIRARPERYVLKYDGDADLLCQTFAGRARDGSDVLDAWVGYPLWAYSELPRLENRNALDQLRPVGIRNPVARRLAKTERGRRSRSKIRFQPKISVSPLATPPRLRTEAWVLGVTVANR